MRGKKGLTIYLICVLLLVCFITTAYSQTETDEETAAPDITTWTQLPDDHQEVDLAQPCMLCHNLTVDATTTATKQMVRSGKKLGKSVLWDRIATYLSAGQKTNTFVLATCSNNIPLSTTCDQMLDNGKKVMYAFFEVGTEKVAHIQDNPYVSMNWHKPWENNFSTVLCIQIRGRAELFDGSSKVFDEAVLASFPTIPKENRDQLAARAKENMVVCRTNIDQVVLFDGTLLGQGLCSYQMWRSLETYKPTSYTKKGDMPLGE